MSLTLIGNNEWLDRKAKRNPPGRVGHSLHHYYQLNLIHSKKDEKKNIAREELLEEIDESSKNDNKKKEKKKKKDALQGVHTLVLFGGGSIEENFINLYTSENVLNEEDLDCEKNEYNSKKRDMLNMEDYLCEIYNDVYICKEKNGKFKKWKKIETEGTPCPRAFHSSCVANLGLHGVFLFIHGGKINNCELADDSFYVLNLSAVSTSSQFKNIISHQKNRHYKDPESIKDHLYLSNVICSEKKNFQEPSSSVCSFSSCINSNDSSKPILNSMESSLYYNPDSTTPSESSVSSFSSPVSSEAILKTCSDENSQADSTSSHSMLWEKNEECWNNEMERKIKRRWIRIKTSGKGPSSRYGHTMNFLFPYIILFGGNEQCQDLEYAHCLNDLWIFNLDDFNTSDNGEMVFHWQKIEFHLLEPNPRFLHSTCIWYDKKSNEEHLVLYGGKMKETAYGSRFFLLERTKLDWMWRWKILPVYLHGLNEHRAYHSIVLVKNNIFVLGGEEYHYKYIEKMPTAVYSLKSKKFQYINDFTASAGLRCFATRRAIFCWGGFSDIPCEKPFLPNDFIALHVKKIIKEIQLLESMKDQLDEHSTFFIKADSDMEGDMYTNIYKEVTKLEKRQKIMEKKWSDQLKISEHLSQRMKLHMLHNQRLLQLAQCKHTQNLQLTGMLGLKKESNETRGNTENIHFTKDPTVNKNENNRTQENEMIIMEDDTSKEKNVYSYNAVNDNFPISNRQNENIPSYMYMKEIDEERNSAFESDISKLYNSLEISLSSLNSPELTNFCLGEQLKKETLYIQNSSVVLEKAQEEYKNELSKIGNPVLLTSIINGNKETDVMNQPTLTDSKHFVSLDREMGNGSIQNHCTYPISANANVVNNVFHSNSCLSEENAISSNSLEDQKEYYDLINSRYNISNVEVSAFIEPPKTEEEKFLVETQPAPAPPSRARRKTAEKCLQLIENDRLSRLENQNKSNK